LKADIDNERQAMEDAFMKKEQMLKSRDLHLEDQKKLIAELQRKSEQGSQQMQVVPGLILKSWNCPEVMIRFYPTHVACRIFQTVDRKEASLEQ
jgi:hypothetical protein